MTASGQLCLQCANNAHKFCGLHRRIIADVGRIADVGPSRAASCFSFQRALHPRQTRADKKSRTLRKSFAILKKFDQEDSPSGPQR